MIPEFWIWLLATGVTFGAITVYAVATLRYRFREDALEILALGVPFRAVRYEDIQSAQRGGTLANEHWVTFRLANRVTIQLRRGARSAIVISPRDPEAFIRELQSRLQPPTTQGAR